MTVARMLNNYVSTIHQDMLKLDVDFPIIIQAFTNIRLNCNRAPK